MVIPEVEEVFVKYKSEEHKIEKILRQGSQTSSNTKLSGIEKCNPPELSGDEAKIRNRQILKELEVVKGNLRSKSIFSPTELQWEKVCEQYQENPSLPVTTWHCHLPVFV